MEILRLRGLLEHDPPALGYRVMFQEVSVLDYAAASYSRYYTFNSAYFSTTRTIFFLNLFLEKNMDLILTASFILS